MLKILEKIIASGDIPSEYNIGNKPVIYLWDYKSFKIIFKFQTSHKNGIIHLSFSKDGKYLLSIAFDALFSLEIFDVENFFSVAFINSGNFPIFDASFYGNASNNFITVGYRNISLWKIKGRYIKK